MINDKVKPQERFVKFVEATDKTPHLKIEIKLYSEPVVMTATHTIYTIASITEDDGKRWGELLYQAILTENQVEELFTNIIADPTKFKN